eukprot:9761275-Karenia_brevis.AAC.3
MTSISCSGKRTRCDEAQTAPYQKQKTGFKLLSPRPSTPKIPRAAALDMSASLFAPRTVMDRLGHPSTVIGFDCETHDWLDGTSKKGRIGPFGWYTMNDDVPFARIVQLGWVIGSACHGAPVVVKTAIIQPHGFRISDRATDCHGIAHEDASNDGQLLADVLVDFMRDVSEAVLLGGRVCAHQLEFDAGVIATELQRCGLDELHSHWLRIARRGYCTMNPDAGRWLLMRAGHDVGPETKQHTLGLIRTLQILGLASDDDKRPQRDAAYDARMTRLVYLALLTCAKER